MTGEYHDDRQEYIPANRGGRPLQRPLSAHVNSRPVQPPAPVQLSKTVSYGNGASNSSPYRRRIQSAAPYRRPMSAGLLAQPPVTAWGDTSSQPQAGFGMGATGASLSPGLFAGLDAPPAYHRPDNTRAVPSKEPENMEEELRKMRLALSGYKEQNRLLRTERQRLEEELGRARTNLVKAEELLNTREKTLSPTIGLSQMYRTPETTALVSRLKEQVKTLRAEKDRFKSDLEDLLRTTKATRVAELQSEAHALSQELSRQLEMTAIMRYRMEEAEAMAAAAQRKAEAAEALAREYTEAGSTMPQGPVRLAPGNTISASRVRKTVLAMQQSHRVLLSQAALMRAVFPPGMSMEALAAKAALKAPTAGAIEVLRYLRYHVNKLQTEMAGLPGGRGEDDDLPATTAATALNASKPPRPRITRPRSAGCGPVGSGPADGSKPVEPSSDPRVLLQGVADLVRELRSMDMDSFMSRPDLEADVDQLADVSSLLIAEHKRLTGADTQPQLAEDEDMRSTKNLLYEPQPAADDDLVPRELPEEEEPVEQMADDYKDDFDEADEEELKSGDVSSMLEDEHVPKEPEPEAEPEPEPQLEPEPYEAMFEDHEQLLVQTSGDLKPPVPAPPSVKKESSSGSVRSRRSAPDTPVKHVEGPASSVGEPTEYSTRRSSMAGSMYSGRGWQPEGAVLAEEEEEMPLAEFAVAAVAVVVAAVEAKKEEERHLHVVQEPQPEVDPPGPLADDGDPYENLGPSASNYGDEEPLPEPEPAVKLEEEEEHAQQEEQQEEEHAQQEEQQEEEQHVMEAEELPVPEKESSPSSSSEDEEAPVPPPAPPPPPPLPPKEASDKGWWEASEINKPSEDGAQRAREEEVEEGLPPPEERAWWEETPVATEDGQTKAGDIPRRSADNSAVAGASSDRGDKAISGQDDSTPWWRELPGMDDDLEEDDSKKSGRISRRSHSSSSARKPANKPSEGVSASPVVDDAEGNWWEQANITKDDSDREGEEKRRSVVMEDHQGAKLSGAKAPHVSASSHVSASPPASSSPSSAALPSSRDKARVLDEDDDLPAVSSRYSKSDRGARDSDVGPAADDEPPLVAVPSGLERAPVEAVDNWWQRLPAAARDDDEDRQLPVDEETSETASVEKAAQHPAVQGKYHRASHDDEVLRAREDDDKPLEDDFRGPAASTTDNWWEQSPAALHNIHDPKLPGGDGSVKKGGVPPTFEYGVPVVPAYEDDDNGRLRTSDEDKRRPLQFAAGTVRDHDRDDEEPVAAPQMAALDDWWEQSASAAEDDGNPVLPDNDDEAVRGRARDDDEELVANSHIKNSVPRGTSDNLDGDIDFGADEDDAPPLAHSKALHDKDDRAALGVAKVADDDDYTPAGTKGTAAGEDGDMDKFHRQPW